VNTLNERSTILEGRKAVVTGASGGLGRAIALELARQGCPLLLVGRNESRLKAVSDEVARVGPRPMLHVADFTDAGAAERIAGRAAETLGSVDILVNCAGVFPVASLKESGAAGFDECFSVNVRTPFLLMQHLAPGMADRGWGRIVNIGSSSAYAGFPNTSVYCASKHALLGLSRALFHEFKGRGVRIFCLSPGSIQTDMGRKVPGQTYETFMRPDEVARYLTFIISFDAEMISEEVRLNRVNVQ
jgi:NAD(P)-dependent dehydrogenase (short-subunit alcohol dehydrogenase family)